MEETKNYRQKMIGIGKALLLAYAISLILLLLLALLLWKLNLKEGQVRIGIIAVYLLSCFAAGRSMGKLAGKRRFLWGMAAGICYFLLLIVASTVFMPGAAVKGTTLLATFVLCAVGGMLGGMLA